MKDSFKRLVLLLLVVVTASWATVCSAQTTVPYNLKLLKAQVVDTVDGRDVIVFFSVTATDARDFPPVLSMGITYMINNEPPQRVDIMKSNGKVRIAIYGNTMAEKNPQAFALIKDEVDKLPGTFQILTFYFKNLTNEPIKKLTLTYGLWEKRNQERRIEQEFSAMLE